MRLGPLAAPPGVVLAQEVPKNAEALYQEGIRFLTDGKEKEGFEKLKESLELFPAYYLALKPSKGASKKRLTFGESRAPQFAAPLTSPGLFLEMS